MFPRGLYLVSAALLAAAPVSAQVNPRPLPAGVTDSSIAWGRQLFHGSANCAGCHGQEARGTDEGPALSGALWLHGPGTYEWLIEQIKLGISAHRTWTGKPMPMRDAEVNAILNRVEEGLEAPRNLIRFDIGETVQVTDGPFEGFSGMVEDVDEAHSRLKVTVSIFGRATPVELEFTQVSKGN